MLNKLTAMFAIAPLIGCFATAANSQMADANTFEIEDGAWIQCVDSHWHVQLQVFDPNEKHVGNLQVRQYLPANDNWTFRGNPLVELDYDIAGQRFEFSVTYDPEKNNAPVHSHFNFPLGDCSFLKK